MSLSYICWCSLVRYFHIFKESPLLARLNKNTSDEHDFAKLLIFKHSWRPQETCEATSVKYAAEAGRGIQIASTTGNLDTQRNKSSATCNTFCISTTSWQGPHPCKNGKFVFLIGLYKYCALSCLTFIFLTKTYLDPSNANSFLI